MTVPQFKDAMREQIKEYASELMDIARDTMLTDPERRTAFRCLLAEFRIMAGFLDSEDIDYGNHDDS